MSIRKAYRYFRIARRVAPLPRDLVTRFDILECDEDEILLILSGRVKDRHAIARLKERYGVTTALELLPLLPKRKPRSLQLRILDWLRRAEGSYEHDPLRRQLRKEKKVKIRHGITHTKMRHDEQSFEEAFRR